MKTKLFTTIALSALLAFGGINAAEAAQNVDVKIPTFPVELNGTVYDNKHAEYPLLVYKDITYFPMTYYLTRELGLTTGWSSEKGLYIVQHQEPLSTEKDKMTANNIVSKTYKAVIPTYPITVNGFAIDNSKEKYPLLNFRGVTYFPLTWQYANDEFNWKIIWDAKTGLAVNSHNNSSAYTYLVKMEDDYALFQNYNRIYESYQTTDGDTGYKLAGEKYSIYQLDFSTNKLTLTGDEKMTEEWTAHKSIDYSERFTVKDGALYYQGKAIQNPVPSDNPVVMAYCYPAQSASMIGVTVRYSDQPAPYTPKEQYVFLQQGDSVKRITSWNSADYPQAFYETADAYYACSGGRNVVSRWNNGLSTIIRIDKETGKEVVLNNQYKDYASLEVIGAADDKLYVRALYFGDKNDLNKMEYYSYKVSPVNDGYFYIDGQMKLHKVHDYIDGIPFLSPDGTLYVYDSGQLKIVNLSKHLNIK